MGSPLKFPRKAEAELRVGKIISDNNFELNLKLED